jgi:hypothetical protein
MKGNKIDFPPSSPRSQQLARYQRAFACGSDGRKETEIWRWSEQKTKQTKTAISEKKKEKETEIEEEEPMAIIPPMYVVLA